GESTTVAARELDLSEETIKTHTKHALARLGARNRTHAVHLAHTAGFVFPQADSIPAGGRGRQQSATVVSWSGGMVKRGIPAGAAA
ncbi:MAG: LuxR C-terminal-related transcriptional regulator, partial [Actinoplanes sp.]